MQLPLYYISFYFHQENITTMKVIYVSIHTLLMQLHVLYVHEFTFPNYMLNQMFTEKNFFFSLGGNL